MAMILPNIDYFSASHYFTYCWHPCFDVLLLEIGCCFRVRLRRGFVRRIFASHSGLVHYLCKSVYRFSIVWCSLKSFSESWFRSIVPVLAFGLLRGSFNIHSTTRVVDVFV